METNRKDSSLRQALTPVEPLQLPSNFAYLTLRRIEHERQVRKRRERLVAIATVSASLLLGLAAIGYFYGAALLAAFRSAASQPESFSLIPAVVFCCCFFALLNHFLHRHFLPFK